MYRGVYNGVSTVNKEIKKLHYLYFWVNPSNKLDGHGHQQSLNLIQTYGQPKSPFGLGGIVVRMRTIIAQKAFWSNLVKTPGFIYLQ